MLIHNVEKYGQIQIMEIIDIELIHQEQVGSLIYYNTSWKIQS